MQLKCPIYLPLECCLILSSFQLFLYPALGRLCITFPMAARNVFTSIVNKLSTNQSNKELKLSPNFPKNLAHQVLYRGLEDLERSLFQQKVSVSLIFKCRQKQGLDHPAFVARENHKNVVILVYY